jgi:hypothetical protein
MQTSQFSVVHDPDGVPHQIVGLTWLFALGAAICAFIALTSGGGASALALLAVPAIVITLAKRASSRRDARRTRSR